MRKRKNNYNKKEDYMIKLALATAIVSLIKEIINLLVEIIKRI